MKTRGGKTTWLKLRKTWLLIMATLAIIGSIALNTHDATVADTTEQSVVVPDQRPDTEDTTNDESTTPDQQPTEDETTPPAENSDAEDTTIEDEQTNQVFATEASDDEIPDGGTVYDDHPNVQNILGIASKFHIFAFEAELGVHTAGNVAVGNIACITDFGTTNKLELIDRDINYIQSITKIHEGSFVSAGEIRSNKVIFGEGIAIDRSNPQRVKVNDVDINHLLADEVYQDRNGQTYINFNDEFAKLTERNILISKMTPQRTYTKTDFPDINQRVIDITDFTPDENDRIIINLAADQLTMAQKLTIKGLSTTPNGKTVIINVDIGGQHNFNSTSPIEIIYEDGTTRGNKDDDYGDNHLLWNFHANQQTYAGTLAFDGMFSGSVLAPAAVLVAKKNMDGNLIAKRVEIHAESHRWDLQDNSEEGLVEPEPEEEPDPGIEPEPGPNPEPEPEPGPDPEPDPEPEPEPEPDPEPEPEPDPDPDPDPEPEPEPEKEDPEPDPEPKEVVETDQPTEVDDPETSTELETELDTALALPEPKRTTAVKRVLRKIDSAIVQAKKASAPVQATKLTTLRTRGLAVLHTGRLPQTDERHTEVLTTIGLGMLVMILITGSKMIKRYRKRS
ncbi:collagen-binding domain-containing protein [Lactiplantibacillus daoliensis]|uniref:Collagen-binding domain-containing protein n=1 Tax=Lactiplantibacillus daoliensis TaxID=2559916 RepID=A0ABW1UED3_9LACO|nr:collagen-binding domain-containing protein [Lactiplantibacillus daoliensis]